MLHCHRSTHSGEEKYRICAKKEGIYVLHVHLMEKKSKDLNFYHEFRKNGKPRPKGVNIMFSHWNWRQACNKAVVGRIYGAFNPPATLCLCKPLNTFQHPTETLFGTNTVKPKAAVTRREKVILRASVFCAGLLTVLTLLPAWQPFLAKMVLVWTIYGNKRKDSKFRIHSEIVLPAGDIWDLTHWSQQNNFHWLLCA